MRRFDHLELDDQQQTILQKQVQALDHDERHWLGMADADRRYGLYEGALRYYSRALERNRTVVAAWVGQVQMLVLLGEYPEADLWGRKALELFRGNGALMAARAQALCRLGKLKEAQALCDGALGQSGESAYGWMVRGELMLARRDDLEQHCFNRAVQIDPDWLVRLEIAGIYLHYAILARALIRAREAVELAPHHAHCWYVQAGIEMQMGLRAAAEKSLRRCLELMPKHLAAGQLKYQLDRRRRWKWWSWSATD
jgi:tetratricopeptide (TPR) repeat protein